MEARGVNEALGIQSFLTKELNFDNAIMYTSTKDMQSLKQSKSDKQFFVTDNNHDKSST